MKNKLFLQLLLTIVVGSFLLGGCSWAGRTAGKVQAKVERKTGSLEKGYEQGYEQEKAKTEE